MMNDAAVLSKLVFALCFCYSVFEQNVVGFGLQACQRNTVACHGHHGPPIFRHHCRGGKLCTDPPLRPPPRSPFVERELTLREGLPRLSLATGASHHDGEQEEKNENIQPTSGPRNRFEDGVATPREGATNVWRGAARVHENYLDLWSEILPRLKCLVPISALFVAGTMILPDNAAVRFLSDAVRSALEGVLLSMRFCTEPITRVLALVVSTPYALARQLAKGNISTLSDIGTCVLKTVKRNLYSGLACGNFGNIAKKREVEDGTSDKNRTLTDGVSSWAVVSSIIFAAAHISNHLPAPSAAMAAAKAAEYRDEVFKVMARDKTKYGGEAMISSTAEMVARAALLILRYVPILRAMAQGIITFSLSYSVLCPLFLSHGAMGSFGAHMVWNLFSFSGAVKQIFLRLWVKKIRNRKAGGKEGLQGERGGDDM